MGSSLSVEPFRSLVVDYVKPETPRALINLTDVSLLRDDLSWSLKILGHADTVVEELASSLAIGEFYQFLKTEELVRSKHNNNDNNNNNSNHNTDPKQNKL